jgi:hypothetical protein
MNLRTTILAAVTGIGLVALSSGAQATDLKYFTTMYGTDYVTAGYGGMRGIGTGTLSVSGITGPVTKAYLYWHGPANSSSPSANQTVDFNGTSITGSFLGISSDNCWGFADSLAYRADVTSLVTGNGSYSLANFLKPGVADINGVSLITFFNDGIKSDNRDVVIFDGNDSNINNPYDAPGWNITLNGIKYNSGKANIVFGVSDGQTFPDAAVLVNGKTFIPAGSVFDGNSVPGGPGGPSNGLLWDIKSYDVTSFLTPGTNSLNITSGVNSDCLSCIHILVDLPAGAAPRVPEPASIALFGAALAGFGSFRRRRRRA